MKFGVQRTGSSVPYTEDFYYLTLLGFISAFVCALAAYMVIVLNRNFLTIACDTALLQNGIVDTMHGRWFRETTYYGPNLLGIHTSFLLLLVIPFYVVAPFPETLFALQCVGVFSTVIPLYLMARDFGFKPAFAYIIASTSLLSAFYLHMAMAPFHLETWIAAAALWAYHFYLRGNMVGFVTCLLVAVCCGEQAALIFISLGISLLVVKDDCAWRLRFGLISLLGGVSWLALAVVVICPHFAQASPFNIYAYNYAQWGVKSAAGLPGAILAHPSMALGELFSGERWVHLVSVVGLLVVTAFCSRRSLVLLLPLPAYLLMADQEFYLYFHAYYYTFLFVAGYIGLFHVLRRLDPLGQSVVAALSLFWLVAVLALCVAAGYYYQLLTAVDEPFSTELRQEFAKIPDEASVYGPHRYSVYLSNRINFVMGDMPPAGADFDSMVEAQFDKTDVHANQIDFIVSDLWTDQCGWRRGFMSPQDSKRRQDAINRLVASGRWEVAWQSHDAFILRRR